MTALELKNFIRATLVAQRTKEQEYTAFDAVIDFIIQSITSGIPDWTNALTFNLDGTGAGSFSIHPDTDGKIRFWKTKTNGNINHAPPTNPLTNEDAYWIEVSPGSGSAIKEWSPSVYGSGLIIVYNDISGDGSDPALYILKEAIRPFNSTDFEAELADNKWKKMSGAGGGSGIPITATYDDIADMLADQANQEAGEWFMVEDASADPDITAGWCIYQYKGTTAGTLADYVFILDEESLNLVVPDASETVKGISELLNQTESEAVATAGTSAGADHTRVVSGRGLWWWWAKLKTAALTWAAGITATDLTASNQSGTGYRFTLFDSAGKIVRNGSAEFNTTTGEMTLRGLDNLDATYTLSIYNQAGDLIFQASNGKFIRVGGTEAIYKISTSVGSGLARTIINANHNMGYIWEDTNGKEYFSLRSTTADERFQVKVKHRFDTLSGLAPEDRMQFSVVANAANSSVTLIASIPMPNNEEVVFFEIEFRAISNAGSGGYQKIKGAIQRNSTGNVVDFGTQVADAINRTSALNFTFAVVADDTANKRININFTNNSSGGLPYLLLANAKWQRVTEPA